MIGVSWNYMISKFLFEAVEARSGNVAAGSILLEPVLSFRSYVTYRCAGHAVLSNTWLKYTSLLTEPSNHTTGRQGLLTNLTHAMIFSPFPLLHSITFYWCAGTQYRSFCEYGGDLNTNRFSSSHITISNHNSGSVN